MAFKTFVNGFPLNASELNEYLMYQSIAVFVDATARNAAITSPVDGQYAHLTGSDTLTRYNGTAWENVATVPTLTASRAITTNGSGALSASTVTATELGYVSGVTSAIQTQIDTKANAAYTINNISANYTIVAGDSGKFVVSTGSAITVTVANVLTVGQRIDFLQDGAGQITFAAGSGVTLQSKASRLKTAAQESAASIICVASGQYRLIGDIAA
jgi:hypothetical protein